MYEKIVRLKIGWRAPPTRRIPDRIRPLARPGELGDKEAGERRS
jgi:hypothetical protein